MIHQYTYISNLEIDQMDLKQLREVAEHNTCGIGVLSQYVVYDIYYFVDHLYSADVQTYYEMLDRMIKANLNKSILWFYVMYLHQDKHYPDYLKKITAMVKQYIPESDENTTTNDLRLSLTEYHLSYLVLLTHLIPEVDRFIKRQIVTMDVQQLSEFSIDYIISQQEYRDLTYEECVQNLIKYGITVEKFIAMYLHSYAFSSLRGYQPIPLDALSCIVEKFPEDAEKFLDIKKIQKEIPGQFHVYFYTVMQRRWIELLFLYYGHTDTSILLKPQKQKKAAEFYSNIQQRLQNAQYDLEQFQSSLKKCGLLNGDELADLYSTKLEKKRRLMLVTAFTCGFQWEYEQWSNCMKLLADELSFILWGVYQEGKLLKVLLRDNDHYVDEQGKEVTITGSPKIGIVHITELTKEQQKQLKQQCKRLHWKMKMPQLSMDRDVLNINAASWSKAMTKHITLVSTAGKWGMIPGSDGSSYASYHLLDPIHKIGAQIRFKRIYSGPEYNSDDVPILGIVFYRYDRIHYGEDIPQMAVCSDDDIPLRFRVTAMAVFKSMAGIK